MIDDAPHALEADFASIFTNKFNSQEVLFATYYDNNERTTSAVAWLAGATPSDYYRQVAADAGDSRVNTVVLPHPLFGEINGKFADLFGGGDTIYYLRLAEVYLVYAEALARSGGTLTDSDNLVNDVEDAINTIRSRAGLSNVTANTRQEFITAIREEKLLELVTEQGESWFDLIRYSQLDGIDVSAFKSTVQSESQYILPIPEESVVGSNGVVEQNPGY